jgi:predicted DNA-binding protein
MNIEKFKKEKLSSSHVTFNVPKSLKTRFNTWCKANGLKKSWVARKLIEDHLKSVENENVK